MVMRAPGFIRTPFGLAGDKVAIPIAVQPNGSVSFTQGWGPDYEKDLQADPANAKPVSRAVENQLMYIITQILNRFQLESVPEFISPADNDGNSVAYPSGAMVLVFDVNNKRQVWLNSSGNDNNLAPPTAAGEVSGNGWTLLASVIGNYLVLNTGAVQTVTGPIKFTNPLLEVPTQSLTATPGLAPANTNYVTRGRSLSHPTSITYGDSGMLILPTAMGAPTLGRYCRQWGIARSPNPSNTEDLSWYVYFPTPFLTPPLVTLTAHSTNVYNDYAMARISSIDRFGFTCRATNVRAINLTLAVGVNWAADGILAATL